MRNQIPGTYSLSSKRKIKLVSKNPIEVTCILFISLPFSQSWQEISNEKAQVSEL